MRPKIWASAGASLFVWFALVVVLGRALGLKGHDLLLLRLGLWFLGLVAALFLIWYFHKEAAKHEPQTTRQRDDLEAAFALAKSRLSSSRFAERARLGNLPLVVVLGPEGSGKTTTVTRSGLDPELLAGEVFRGETMVSTRAANLWYSQKTVFVEAGGRLLTEPARWQRLVRGIQPSRISAALSGRTQAPRAAIVCLSCEELLRPGGSEATMAAARDLRVRLAEVSQKLGIRLPVYVFLTKADRIPYFSEWVRHLSGPEVSEVFGATLPWDSGPAGSYADRIAPRITRAMERLVSSLALRRLHLLPRETQPELLGSAYEFAREFRKLAPLATQFLVELCRPSQLEVSPFLRGFYLSGVRAIIINEGAAQAAPALQQADARRMDATQAFTPAFNPSAQRAQAAVGVTRKVPQWVFLDTLFRDVILKDRVAMGVTGGGTRVNVLRRILLATAAGLALVFSIGFVVAYMGNRKLQTRLLDAAQTLKPATVSAGDLPTADVLRRLDKLREAVSELALYEDEGAPLDLRWGLYSGSRMFPDARRLYFGEFNKLMFRDTYGTMLRTMQTLPNSPKDGSEYPSNYSLLKAYLIVSAYPKESTPDSLPPVLLKYWTDGRTIDDERQQAGSRQFTFYATELRRANPIDLSPDTAVVEHTRNFLRQFTGATPMYGLMKAEAEKANPPVNFSKLYPGAGATVTVGYIVPGSFTAGGYTFMQQAFKEVDKYFAREAWVMGDLQATSGEKAKVVEQVRTQYRNEFIQNWKRFLASARIAGYSGPKDAAQKLASLSSQSSPLLQLFYTVSKNTAVDSAAAATIFQPVQLLTPPGSPDKLIGDASKPYMDNLLALQGALEAVGSAPAGQGDGAAQTAIAAATAARTSARAAAQGFTSDPNSVSQDVQRLMLAPPSGVDPVLSGFGATGLNKSGTGYCGQFERLMSAVPFKSGTTTQADLAEVSSLYASGTGAIWAFYNDVASKVLVQQGTRYAAKPTADPKADPGFVDWFNRHSAFSRTLWKEGQPDPRLDFTLRPILSDQITLVTLSVGGQTRYWSRTSNAGQTLKWVAAESPEVKLTVKAGGNEVVQDYKGPWGLFQLFQSASGWRQDGIAQKAQWVVTHEGQQVPVPFELTLNAADAPLIFQRDYFPHCGRIAR